MFITQALLTGSVEKYAVSADFAGKAALRIEFKGAAWRNAHIIYMMAGIAYKMVMRPGVAVKMVAVLSLNPECLTMLDQKGKIPVYCSETYVRINLLNMPVYLLGCGM